MSGEETKEKVPFNVPLRKINYTARVAGMFAQVTCSQEYQNQGPKSVEAIYIFPLPEESSVVGCRMVIGQKTIEAELKELTEARKKYEEAVAAGHYASLLEQKRANIFRMSVGGIEPGERIEVVTTYNQRVLWQDNGGRFNIPLVVAPRFIPGIPTGKTGDGWAEDTDVVPDASQITPVVSKEGVPYTADIKVALSSGFACKITSPSHGQIVGEHRSKGTRAVTIEAQGLIPDRDFILCYQTESVQVGAGAHRGSFANEQFAVMEVIPPGQVVDKPKDIIYCLDESGSMIGPKIEGLKLVVEKVTRRLLQQGPGNRIAIVAFADEHRFPDCYEVLQPLSEIKDDTFAAISKLRAGGGTRAGRTLDYCFQQFPADETGREKYILLVSDGQTEDRWSRVVPGIRVIAMGIDVAVNEAYLRDIARESGGTSISVYPGEDYDVVAGTLAGLLSGPVLRNVQVLSAGRALEGALGISDVYRSMPGIIYLRASQLPEEIQIVGIDSNDQSISLPITLKDTPECSFCHQLWAREKLRDHTLEVAEQIKISLQYGVLCSKTAFVAVHLKEIPGAKPERVEIPVALPHTWDYDAVFGQTVTFAAMVRGGPGHLLRMADLGPEHARRVLGPSERQQPTLPVKPATPSLRLAEELEQLVNELEKGSVSRVEAENRWKILSLKIKVTQIKNWTAVEKAKTYYLLLKLQTYGFAVSKAVLTALSVQPDPSDAEAYAWWEKARKFLGIAVPAAPVK